MYLKLDPRSGELSLNLPADLQEYAGEFQRALMQEFAYEALNRSTLQAMNTFLVDWFTKRGLPLSPETGEGAEA